jgi:hypothetical protein
MACAAMASFGHALVELREFQESALAKNLAADRQRFEERQEEFRKKLAALPADQKPARNYVAKNACPFECCTYRTWDVLADTVLYDQPNGQKVVARITKGEKVEGLTGEVHLNPAPVAVLATPPESNVPPGSIVFVLDNLGEGFAHVWREGQILDLSVYLGVREQCTFPGTEEGCWGEWLDRPDAAQAWPVGVWWAQIKTPGGVTGWTIVPGLVGELLHPFPDPLVERLVELAAHVEYHGGLELGGLRQGGDGRNGETRNQMFQAHFRFLPVSGGAAAVQDVRIHSSSLEP